jgi:N-acetylmuramic acid 6-phosphate etherase
MSLLLAVDLGKTTCRAALLPPDGGDPVAAGATAGAPGLAHPHGVALALAAIRAAAPDGAPDAVVVGAAGALAAPRAAQALADELARAFTTADVMVTSDAILAHAAALAGAPGVVLVAGTGAVAVALAADGRLALADGAGPWLGDEGSGAWIGLAGLRAALRAHDGRGAPTALEDAATARFGELAGLARRLGGDPVASAASFAPDVARAAVGEDATATAILADAAHALAAAAHAAAKRAGSEPADAAAMRPGAARAHAAAKRAGSEPADAAATRAGFEPAHAGAERGARSGEPGVALTGGLVGLGEALLGPLRAALEPLVLRPAAAAPIHGARVLARADGPHAVHTTRARVPHVPGHPLDRLSTEAARADLDDLDERPIAELVSLLVDSEARAHEALRRALPALAAATEAIAARLAAGGRLRYVGAGTSGRIALQDAAEWSPTFGTDPALVAAVVAGGERAAWEAVEGAEDDDAAGARDLEDHGIGRADAVVGLSASGRTPYVLGALRAARAAGALTIAVVNAPGGPVAAAADLAVEVDTGAEVLAGSTRLTAATTQKIVLNALSTAALIHLGKAYGPWMVDVRATNEKLRRRAVRIVAEAAAVDDAAAQRALDAAGGHVKTAVVALLAGVGTEEARERLDRAQGRVRAAIE